MAPGRRHGGVSPSGVERALSEAGVDVVAELAAIIRCDDTPAGLRARILLDLLPYVAPRLSHVEVRGESEVRYVVEVPEGSLRDVTPEEWQQRWAPPALRDVAPIVIDPPDDGSA